MLNIVDRFPSLIWWGGHHKVNSSTEIVSFCNSVLFEIVYLVLDRFVFGLSLLLMPLIVFVDVQTQHFVHSRMFSHEVWADLWLASIQRKVRRKAEIQWMLRDQLFQETMINWCPSVQSANYRLFTMLSCIATRWLVHNGGYILNFWIGLRPCDVEDCTL